MIGMTRSWFDDFMWLIYSSYRENAQSSIGAKPRKKAGRGCKGVALPELCAWRGENSRAVLKAGNCENARQRYRQYRALSD
jgi:hypothetical protein